MGQPRVATTTLLAVTAAGMTTTALVGPIVPDILADFDQPTQRAGLVIGLSTLPAIVFSPILGALADRHGRAAVLRPCLVLFAVLGAASAAAPTFETLLVLRFLHGLPAAGLVVLAVVLISDQWSGADRAVMMTRNAAVLTGSLAVFPVIGGAVSDLAGWRAVYALYALAVLPLLGIPRVVRPVTTLQKVPLARELRDTGRLLGVRRIGWSTLAGTVMLAFIFGWNVTLLPLHAEEVLGLSAGVRGAFVGAGAAVATITALIFGRWVGSITPLWVMVMACGVFVAGWGLVWSAGAQPVLVGVGIAATGLAQGVVGPTLQTVIASDAPEAQRGAALSLWGSSIRLGQTLGPALMTIFLVFGSTTTTYLVGVIVALCLGLVLVPFALRSTTSVSEVAA